MNPASLAAGSAALFLATALFAHTVAARLLLLAFGALCCAAALVKDRRALSALPPVWLPFLLWAAWCAASLLWSQEPARSLKEFRNEAVYPALAFWACYVAAQARAAPRLVLPALAAAAILVCAVALYNFQRDPIFYNEGWHGGSGNFSSALITLMPCVLAAGWYFHGRGRRSAPLWAAALAALLLAGAYTTLNRTIWIAFALQLVLVGGLLALRGRRPGNERMLRIGAIAAAGLVAASVIMTYRVQLERSARDDVEVTRDPRPHIWAEVLERVEERPLTGYGFGRGLLRHALNEEFRNPLLWHAHNLFLDMALQAGLPGLLLFLLLLGALLREGWRMARAPDAAAAACGIALVTLIAGMVVRNMTDTLLVRQNALFFWGIAGMLLAWGRPPPARA
jgi:O-antigen ligase